MTKMAIENMALVNERGQVINKILIDTNKHYEIPKGWSMHIWTEPLDNEAYILYLKERGIIK